MHVIAVGLLAKTPIPVERCSRLAGARIAQTPLLLLPPPSSQPPRAMRRVPADGVIMVAQQRLRVGPTHAGKTVTVVIDETIFRVLYNDIELAAHPRKNPKLVTRFKAHARTR